ncbi:chemotaxis protein CheC [Bacillus sp. FJAT-42376]|uniref:chemotaxis protein CheC n=1 Tax=Bacillus sp. FJAT-42376 TaxID=2014076 RepID=UPI000F4DD3E4|nr:chemotaxis protein CheC [Bacillus sp. FJAT-42376]AZB42960.1 chemotaxis protein CheC [Bacillus sp. FJAT-42376]
MGLKFEQLDVLKEMANIGAAHSATALSHMLGRKIGMDVPEVRVVSFDELMEAMGGAEKEVACIFLGVSGEISGSMYFIMEVEQAEAFVKEITDHPTARLSAPPYDEYVMSAIKELGNILIGSYLSSMSDLTKLSFLSDVPEFSADMFGAIISEGLIELSKASDLAVLIRTVIREERDKGNYDFQGHLFFLPDYESFENFYRALGVGDGD